MTQQQFDDLYNKSVEEKTPLDVHGEDLSGLELREKNLISANFTNTICRGTKFVDCYLCGANFTGADISNADIYFSDANKAVFDNAKCQQTRFVDTKLRGASFVNANLSQASLKDGTDVYHATFKGADISYCKCGGLKNADDSDFFYGPARWIGASMGYF